MKGVTITQPPAKRPFTTISGVPIEPLYGPEHLRDFDPERDLAAEHHRLVARREKKARNCRSPRYWSSYLYVEDVDSVFN